MFEKTQIPDSISLPSNICLRGSTAASLRLLRYNPFRRRWLYFVSLLPKSFLPHFLLFPVGAACSQQQLGWTKDFNSFKSEGRRTESDEVNVMMKNCSSSQAQSQLLYFTCRLEEVMSHFKQNLRQPEEFSPCKTVRAEKIAQRRRWRLTKVCLVSSYQD